MFTVLLGAPQALAHTELEKSSPAAGARLAAAPSSVSLTFGEAVRLPANPIRVTGPDSAVWTVGAATATDATVTAPVSATGPAGAYTLTWQVIAGDGDTVRGTVRFTLTAPAAAVVAPASPPGSAAASPPVSAVAPVPATADAPTAVPAATPPVDEDGGVPGWLRGLAGAAVLAVAAGTVVARRARKNVG
ncbi:MAG: copper resistance protein CopC [Pseudonocardia sp.]|nr:copper resistance protein CopC [Pseudonocardia sp.]